MEDPSVVFWHEGEGYDKSAAKSSDCSKHGTHSVCLLGVGDGENDEERDPCLVDEEEC